MVMINTNQTPLLMEMDWHKEFNVEESLPSYKYTEEDPLCFCINILCLRPSRIKKIVQSQLQC